METNIKDPIQFFKKMELFTIAIVASLISWKLLNSIYDNFYQPIVDSVIDDDNAQSYYIDTGKTTIPIGKFINDIIKWLIIFIILMIIYFYW